MRGVLLLLLGGVGLASLLDQICSINKQIADRNSLQIIEEHKHHTTFYFEASLNESLFENSPTHTHEETDLQIHASMNLPFQDHLSYPLLIQTSSGYFTLKGKEIIAQTPNQLLFINQLSHQYLYFLQVDEESAKIFVKKFSLFSKELHLEETIQLKVTNPLLRNDKILKIQVFFLANVNGKPNFITVLQDLQVIMFGTDGRINEIIAPFKQLNQTHSSSNLKVKQILKRQNVLFMRVEGTHHANIYFQYLQANLTRGICTIPTSNLIQILQLHIQRLKTSQEHVFVKVLQKRSNSIIEVHYQLRLRNDQCDTQSKTKHFAFDEVTDQETIEKQAKQKMEGRSMNGGHFGCEYKKRELMIKRWEVSSICVSICSNGRVHNLSTTLIEANQLQSFEPIDFSKFRIPLLLITFGIIIFIAMKNHQTSGQLSQTQTQTQPQIQIHLSQQQLYVTHPIHPKSQPNAKPTH